MHLNLNLRARGFHRAAWRHPTARPAAVTDVGFVTELVRIAEDAAFDAVFLADTPVHREPLVQPLEPLALLAAVAAGTSRIGLIGTLSATYTEPGQAASRLASLDLLSGGRVGVNVVTNAGDEVARNFGADAHPEHADRYARAADFLDTLLSTWSRGVRSPQGQPVIVQAGASDAGRELAGRYAEAVYTGSSTVADGVAFRSDVLARAERAGRPAGSVRILPGLIPYVGRTERAARELEAELEALAVRTVDPVVRLGGLLGLDLGPYDPDGPVPLADLPAVADFRGAVSRYVRLRTIVERERPSIRELAERAERSLHNVHWTIAGTGRQVADQLERWFRAGAADGFNVLVPLHPDGLSDFTEQVVPELRRRGLVHPGYRGRTLREHLDLPVPHPVPA